jgi:hypothetical protein
MRSFALCSASLVGAVLWYEVGPQGLLYTAFGVGCVGAGVFYLFCRGADENSRFAAAPER